MKRSAVTVILASLLYLAGCGGGADGENTADAGDDSAEALDRATTACNSILKPEDDATVVEKSQEAADVAAQAGNADPKWNELASAISDLAVARRNLVEVTEKLKNGEDITTDLEALLADGEDYGKAVVAECRKVLAAGGDVDEEHLNDFGAAS